MPGYSLGYPMYHALTGNLPVVSTDLHRPDATAVQTAPAAGAPSAPAGGGGGDALQPGWVELVDPITSTPFWWNVHYRSRRAARPAAGDDGKRGAGQGEKHGSGDAALRRAAMRALMEGKTWEEKYDAVNSRPYYWNRKANTTQWERPPAFYEDGVGYRSRWSEDVDAATGELRYRDRATGVVQTDIPDNFDGLPR